VRSLFGKKESLHALAEVLEDGLALSNQEMKKLKYNTYKGAEPMFEVLVRLQPGNDPPYETRMKAGLGLMFLLKPGVRVQVSYDPGGKGLVSLEDDLQAILQRNPQLIKKD
jgi:hypothetical protein